MSFFLNATATTEIYTLSLHDALPISDDSDAKCVRRFLFRVLAVAQAVAVDADEGRTLFAIRSEEHTSELQSQSNLVCRLLLEKKKTTLPDTMTQSRYRTVMPKPHCIA